MQKLKNLIIEFWSSIAGVVAAWFLFVMYLILTISAASDMMNDANTLLFYTGIAIILFDAILTIFIIKKQINRKK